MKILLLIISAAVLGLAQGSPSFSRETDIEEAVEKVLEQAVGSIVQDEDQETEEKDEIEAVLQSLLSAEQSDDAELQGFFKKLWKGVKKVAKKGFKYGKKLYKLYNRVKNCAEVEDMPEQLEDAAVEALVTHEQNTLLQSLEAEAQSDSEEEEEQLSVELQDFLARQQVPASAQGFFKKLWKGAKKLVKKGIKYGRKAMDIYNKVKNGGSCVQKADISDELDDAVAEALIARENEAMKFAFIEELFE